MRYMLMLVVLVGIGCSKPTQTVPAPVVEKKAPPPIPYAVP